jgi:predicted PurR-regulated permease PerM
MYSQPCCHGRENQEMKQTTEGYQDQPAAGTLPGPVLRPESRATPVTLTDAERRRHARIQSSSLAVLATGGLLTLMYVAKSVLVLILVSILLAFMLAPIVELCHRLRLPRSVGAMFAVLLMCTALYAVFYISYNQADQFMSALPKYSGNIRSVLNQVRLRAERVRQTTQGVLPEDKPEKGTVTVRESTSWLDELTSGAVGVTEVVLMAAFIPFLVFFMLSWQDHVRVSTVMLFSSESSQTAFVTLGLIAQMIRGFIVGNFIIGVILGIASSIAFWILGVPYFYVIGMISGIVSLLPYLGIVLAILPPVMVSLGLLTTERFVGIVTVVAVSHVIALNLLYPKIIGRRLRLNPLAVILALLFWGWLWGAMGLVLAVPLTAAIKIIFDHVEGLQAWGAWLGE